MRIDVTTLARRPDRRDTLAQLNGLWPMFMRQDPSSDLYYTHQHEWYPEFLLLATDADTGEAVAKALSVPVSGCDPAAGLPEGGWDWAMRQAVADRVTGTAPTAVCAVEIMVRPDLRGGGLSGRMLAEMRDNAARLGFADLVAPVRPNGKHLHPDEPVDAYAHRTRDDGLPVDPWLRVHVRAGGRIVNVAHHSMTIAGTLAGWREWTGLPFDTTGPVTVPEALSPVHCDVAQDHAVYVEPNVWVHHRT